MNNRNLRITQIIYSIVVVTGIFLLSIIVSSVLLRSLRRTTEDKISQFVAADAHQMEINVDNYFQNVQQVTALLFSDKGYYLYDATDPDLSDYEKIQHETAIQNRIVDLGMMNNFCDFGIVYPNDYSTGWISQVTGQMFKEGGFYSYFDSAIPSDNLKQDVWMINVRDNTDRIYYAKRLNPNAICVVSFYISELQNVLQVPSELSDMNVRLVNSENYVIYSTNEAEEASVLNPAIASITAGSSDITAINSEYLITSNSLTNGWRVICSIPVAAIMADQVEAIKNLVLIVLIITIVIVLAMLLITDKLNSTVNVVVVDLDSKAKSDLMTGLLNKSSFKKLAQSDLQDLRPGKAVAFLMFDLDNFKNVNDMAGHKEGDEVIRRMGSLLNSVFKEEGALIGRVGGDEFAVYKSYANITPDKAADRIRLLTLNFHDRFEHEFKEENEKFHISVSSGVLVTANDGRSFDDLYEQADSALYESKRSGKSKPTFAEGKI